MTEILGIPPQALFGQLLIGLINGAFYAMMSLGLAVIFGMLNIINFVHGAQYMMGAFVAWVLLNWAGIGYWGALVLAPLNTGISWKWVPGSKWLFNANVNKCFAISQANINDGVSVVTYACNTGINQLWSLV